MSIVRIFSLDRQVNLSIDGSRAAQALHAIGESWSWCLREEASSADGPAACHLRVVLDDDPGVISEAETRGDLATSSLEEMMHRLSQEITIACIDRQVGHLLMLHGCALADPTTGRAIAAVAPSGTGKTTFIRTLGKGRVYLSDETVGLREDNTVVPHLKPLSVHPQGEAGYKEQIDPGAFDLLAPSQDSRLADLWFLHRVEEPTEPRIDRLGTLEALTTIAPQISYLSSTPRPLRRLAETFDVVGGLKLVRYHEASDLEPLVSRALEPSP
jgi:hypothetical protein